MSFYMDVQFVDEKKGNISVFEVVFSNHSDDKMIEGIISGGLNAFQKRNPYIQVEDGFIEFFDDNSIKLRIESICKYPLSKRRIEDLKQELIVAFKMTSEERALLQSKRQVENKDKQVLTAIQEMREEWDTRLVNEIAELRKSFTDQLSALQPGVDQGIGLQLQAKEAQQLLQYQELQEAIMLGNEYMTEHVQEIIQKEKSSSAQLKKRIAALDSSIGKRNEELSSSLTEIYKEITAGNFEKVDFLKEKLSSEIDENNFELKEEIRNLNTVLSKKIEEDVQQSVSKIQQLAEQLVSGNKKATESEKQLNQRLNNLIATFEQVDKRVAPLSTLLDEKLGEKITAIEQSINALSEKVIKLPSVQVEDHSDILLSKISEVKNELDKKMDSQTQTITEAVQLTQEKSTVETNGHAAVDLEAQLNKMKQLISANVHQITPMFSTLQKENILLSRKIDSLESMITELKEANEERQVSTTSEAVIKEPVVSLPEKEVVIAEKIVPKAAEPKPEASAATPVLNKEQVKPKEPSKLSEPERTIKKITAKDSKPVEGENSNPVKEEKTDVLKTKRPAPQRLLPKAEEVGTTRKEPRKRPVVNPFRSDFLTLKECFLELENAPRFDKQVRLSKFDYRKSVTHVHYIEYRWENAVLDKDDYQFFGLENFEKQVKELPEFLAVLKSDSKKESLFNQNSFKMKKTVWERIKAYHLLSIYLDQILEWRQG
ncbi:hypothetical protein [Candidatus Enterococcus clewellii]|uniref:hypothetical protein n=1 Tax=Candidatus Enterococcus clewellii TaxID=1834193 RepID=UPI000A353582|nr:hypothetical protein [Enterococcus sp. 9E7_DIV0242]